MSGNPMSRQRYEQITGIREAGQNFTLSPEEEASYQERREANRQFRQSLRDGSWRDNVQLQHRSCSWGNRDEVDDG